MDRPFIKLHPLPLSLKVANGAVNIIEKCGLRVATITPEQAIKDASRRARLPPKFPKDVESALEILCRSVKDDTDLHYFGRENLREVMVGGLEMRLRLDEIFRKNPELEKQPLIPPLIVTGLPRSGTTFLHRLLCETEEARPIPLYEGFYPVPRKPVDTRLWDTKIKLSFWHGAAKPYNLDAIHFIRAELPDECNFPIRLGMCSTVFWSIAPVSSYFEWLLEQEMRETYQYYRRVLLLLQANSPGKRLVLKCPSHLAWMEALVEAIPEALIVQTHRNPLESLPSESKLILSMQALATHKLDWEKIVQLQTRRIEVYANRSVQRNSQPIGQKIFHVDYRDLINDPIATASSIRKHFQFPLTSDHLARLEKYSQKNRQYKHGKNPYTLEQFNLDAKQLEEKFSAYTETFLSSQK